jgi:hypothetical protein
MRGESCAELREPVAQSELAGEVGIVWNQMPDRVTHPTDSADLDACRLATAGARRCARRRLRALDAGGLQDPAP